MADETPVEQATSKGWVKGRSGNPKGRPCGPREDVPTRNQVLHKLWAVACKPTKDSMAVVTACRTLLDHLPKPGMSLETPRESGSLPSWLKDEDAA